MARYGVVALSISIVCVGSLPPSRTATNLSGSRVTVEVLRDIASGRVSPGSIAGEVSRCVAIPEHRPGGCGQRLERVLEAYAVVGPAEKQAVVDALRLVETQATDSRWIGEWRSLETRLRTTPADAQAEAKPIRPREAWYDKVAGGSGPPSRAQQGKLARADFQARLLAFVNRVLPTDRQQRVRRALQGATARDCETALGGSVRRVCTDLGLPLVQWASLRLAVDDLYEFDGGTDVIDLYLGQDQTALRAAVAAGNASPDDVVRNACAVLDKWMQRKPSRWEAWADIEGFLAPDPWYQ
jgi:hypothetical protein